MSGFLGFNDGADGGDGDGDEGNLKENDALSAWSGKVDIFGDQSDGSFGAFRSTLKSAASHNAYRTPASELLAAEKAREAAHIPGGRAVDWDAYLGSSESSEAVAITHEQRASSSSSSSLSTVESVFVSCGGPSNVTGWRDFYPPSLPLLHRLPVWDLRTTSNEMYTASFGSEFTSSIFDDFRVLLEESDSAGTFTFHVTHDPSCGYWSGLAREVAEEMKSECRSADQVFVLCAGRTKSEAEIREGNGDADQQTRGRRMRAEFRGVLNAGLALRGVAEVADLVLPVDLHAAERLLLPSTALSPLPPSASSAFLSPSPLGSMFNATAAAAIAIDSAFSPSMLEEEHGFGGVAVAGSGISSG